LFISILVEWILFLLFSSRQDLQDFSIFLSQFPDETEKTQSTSGGNLPQTSNLTSSTLLREPYFTNQLNQRINELTFGLLPDL